MKKLVLIMILVLCVSMLFGDSQYRTWKDNTKLGLQANVNTYLSFMDDNDYEGLFSPGIEGFIDYRISDLFTINMGLGYNQLDIDYSPVLKNKMLSATLRTKFFLFKTKRLSPFINMGVGAFSFSQENGYFTDSKTSTYLTGGVGVEIPLNEKINLVPVFNYHITQDDLDHLPNKDTFLDDEFVTYGLGISFNLGGSKKVEEVPEPIKIEKPEPVEEVVEEQPQEVEVVEEQTEEVAVVEEPQEVEEVVEVVEEVEVAQPVEFGGEDYMIQPGDFLIKIANDVYEDKSMWKEIYNWNKDEIGGNADLIYPYNELKLKQAPAENYETVTYTFSDYTLTGDESLMSIAQKQYGRRGAWVVIYRDNKDVLGTNYKFPKEGTVLKIRSNLFK